MSAICREPTEDEITARVSAYLDFCQRFNCRNEVYEGTELVCDYPPAWEMVVGALFVLIILAVFLL